MSLVTKGEAPPRGHTGGGSPTRAPAPPHGHGRLLPRGSGPEGLALLQERGPGRPGLQTPAQVPQTAEVSQVTAVSLGAQYPDCALTLPTTDAASARHHPAWLFRGLWGPPACRLRYHTAGPCEPGWNAARELRLGAQVLICWHKTGLWAGQQGPKQGGPGCSEAAGLRAAPRLRPRRTARKALTARSPPAAAHGTRESRHPAQEPLPLPRPPPPSRSSQRTQTRGSRLVSRCRGFTSPVGKLRVLPAPGQRALDTPQGNDQAGGTGDARRRLGPPTPPCPQTYPASAAAASAPGPGPRGGGAAPHRLSG